MNNRAIESYSPLLNDELIAMRELVTTFLRQEVWPVEAACLQENLISIPHEDLVPLQGRARESGLWCFGTPAEYGGAGLDLFTYTVVVEAAAQHTFSLPDAGGGVFGYDPPSVLQHATREQRERYIFPSVRDARQWFVAISESSGGSDPARSIQTNARRVQEGWIVNGSKMWASRADVAANGVVFARTGEGRAGISAFIVDLPHEGIECRPVPVMRDSHTTELTFNDVVLPPDSLIGEVGEGFALAQKWLTAGRLRIAAQTLGVAQLALDMACDYAKERVTFGKVLASRQMVQERLVDSHIELRSARALLYEIAHNALETEIPRSESSTAKVYCTEVAFQVVDRAIQIFGAMGVAKEMPLEHWFRALRIDRIVEGPSEVHKMAVARDLLGSRIKD